MSPGYTLIEMLAAITIMVVIAGAALPIAHAGLDRSRALAAARYLTNRMALARFEAVKRSAFVGIQFVGKSDGDWFRTYVDGNRNGVRSRDISQGLDQPISAEERLDHRFTGVGFGIHPGVIGLDTGERFDVNDPIQIGPSTIMSFSPNGSTTAGTVFIRGGSGNQFAVRVLGATGRTRILAFNFADGTWRTP